MEDKEELDLIRKKLSKIRFSYIDETRKIKENSKEDLEFVSERFDLLRDNFYYFVVAPNSIMYPDEFIAVLCELDEGKQLVFDNIELLLMKNSYKKDRLVNELLTIDGVENAFAENFERNFNAMINDNPDYKDDYKGNADYINFKHDLCTYDQRARMQRFMDAILKKSNSVNILTENSDVFISPKFNTAMADLVEELAGKPEFSEFIKNNFDEIRKSTIEKDIVRLYKSIKDIYPEEYEKHKFTIEKIYEPAIQQVEVKKETLHPDDYKGIKEQITNTCSRIIAQDKTKDVKSLLEFSANGEKIEICNSGAFAIAMKAGDKIFKFGGDRAFDSKFEIPNHPRLLRPIIRKKDVSVVEKHPLYIEVQDEVDVETEISDEELIMVYRELREAGIKWCDAKKNNLGRLKKDNLGYPIGQGVPANNQSLGLIGEDDDNQNVLKAGDLVVIDLDFMYSVDFPGATLNPEVPDFIRKVEEEYQEKEKQEREKASRGNVQKKFEEDDYGEH